MRLLFTILLALLTLSAAPPSDTSPPSKGFREMFDSNRSYDTSLRRFDRAAWEERGELALSLDQTLNIPLSENVFLKTMVVVNLNSAAARTGLIGVEKILFGLEIRFEGF
jgi:hypothetical protein